MNGQATYGQCYLDCVCLLLVIVGVPQGFRFVADVVIEITALAATNNKKDQMHFKIS